MTGQNCTLTTESLAAPIRMTETGIAYIGLTRIPLDTIVYAYRDGASAEDIVDSFDVLSLGDVYAVIAYYLKNRQNVDAYLTSREASREAMRKEIGLPSHLRAAEVRRRLKARRNEL